MQEKLTFEERIKELKNVFKNIESSYTRESNEVDKELERSVYGSVGHINRLVRSSTLKNYNFRLEEVIKALDMLVDVENVKRINELVKENLKESNAELEKNREVLNSVSLFGADYIKYEILVKTYMELSTLYSKLSEIMESIVKDFETADTEVHEAADPAVQPKSKPVKAKNKETEENA